jgi:carboxypeptidase C (cathepsin A)
MLKGLLLPLCLLALAAPLSLTAADELAKPAEKPTAEPGKEAAKLAEPKEELVKSQHSVTINGQKLDYTAGAGTIILRDNEEKPTAAIFYTGSGPPPDHLLLQRRPRFLFRLDAPRAARTPPSLA